MKTVALKDINPLWLRRRYFLCHLPTETVFSDYEQAKKIHLDTVYYYVLPEDEFLCIDRKETYLMDRGNYVESSSYTVHDRMVAVEVHENYGSDGHTEYSFRDKYILVYQSQLPKDFESYRDLVNDMWRQEHEDRDRLPKQLNLTEWGYTASWMKPWELAV